jgi:hypothetical protein
LELVVLVEKLLGGRAMKKDSNIIMLAIAILLAVPMHHGGCWIVKNPQSPSELLKFTYEIETRTGEVLILGSTGTGTDPKKAYEEVRRLQSGLKSFDNLPRQQEQKP